MNNNMTTFDEQWELLEGQHVARSMVRQLPAWQRRRRLHRRMALTVVGVAAGGGVPGAGDAFVCWLSVPVP